MFSLSHCYIEESLPLLTNSKIASRHLTFQCPSLWVSISKHELAELECWKLLKQTDVSSQPFPKNFNNQCILNTRYTTGSVDKRTDTFPTHIPNEYTENRPKNTLEVKVVIPISSPTVRESANIEKQIKARRSTFRESLPGTTFSYSSLLMNLTSILTEGNVRRWRKQVNSY